MQHNNNAPALIPIDAATQPEAPEPPIAPTVRAPQRRRRETEVDLATYRLFLQEEEGDIPRQDPFGIPIAPAMPALDERRIAILRMLGRLEVMHLETIYLLLYKGRYQRRILYQDMDNLHEQRLVWRTTAPSWRDAKAPHTTSASGERGGRRAYVYGLSLEGKTLLDSLNIEPNQESWERLKARDLRGRHPSPSTLGHDLQVAWWCAGMVECLRLIPWCHSVYCQVEYVSDQKQRIDAVLVARFDWNTPRSDLRRIPWFDGTPLRPGETEVRYALELDNSTEALPVLARKFLTYRDLHKTGRYHDQFNGDVLLVVIVQNPTRAGQLARLFRDAWPDGWGVISTASRKGANSSPYGVLWGTYKSLHHAVTVPLLSTLVRNTEGRVVGYQPLMTVDQWAAYVGSAARDRPTTLQALREIDK